MGKNYKVIGSIIILLLLGGLIFHQAQRANSNHSEKATWLWHTKQIVNEPDKLLTFMQSKKIDVVYLQVNSSISNSYYQSFIHKASDAKIRVLALGGSPSWATFKGLKKQENFFDWLTEYQQSADANEQFQGVHLDVEPYLLDDWKTQYDKAVLDYQITMLTGLHKATELGLPFEADIPFWFDKRFYHNEFGKGKLSEWIIDNSDVVTIMAYRDKAIGRNGVIELSRSEIEYAHKKGKQVSIGIETTQSSEGDSLSFYEEGEQLMEEQLAIVHDAFKGHDSFNGFSIHSIHSWMALNQ